jgi:hypothetical protein
MGKHWLAVLFIFGLAGSSTPALAQVLKSAKTADTKSESTIKNSKQSPADAASKDSRRDKWKVQSVEGGHATDVAAMTSRKAGGEQQSESMKTAKKNILVSDVKSKKTDSEHKQASGAAAIKSRKAGSGQQSEFLKVSNKDIMVSKPDFKTNKSSPELNAAQQDATKRARKQVDQASPK